MGDSALLTVDLIFSRAQLAELEPFAVLNLMCLKGLHTFKVSRHTSLIFAGSSGSAIKHVREKSCVAE